VSEPARCPLCGGEDLRRFAEGERGVSAAADARSFGSSRPAIEPVRVLECRSCGLAFRDPRPGAGELEARYRMLRDELYVAEERGRRRSCRRSLRLLERHTPGRRGRLLDVGCSAGFFLSEAAGAGWSVFGLEPSAWKAVQARSLLGPGRRGRVQEATLEKAPFAGNAFDAVVMWDVLEHVADPGLALAQAARLLRPGGILALNVPDVRSPVARLLGRRWPLLLPEHLFYFSRRSLRRLLGGSGFEVLGFYLHPVFFSAGYVLHRLGQHGFPGAGVLAGAARPTGLARLLVPLLMGEVTAVARLNIVSPTGSER